MADDRRQTLFPIPLSNDKEQGAASYLFPCIGLASGGKGECGETSQEWLTNASFKGSDVKILNIVEGSCHGPTSLSESESESEVCQAYPGNERELHKVDQRSPKVKHKRKRKHSDSDSSSSPEPKADESERRSKHKKKHKKHKHKKKLSSNRDSTNEDLNKPNTIWIEESGLEPERAFRVHKKPDRENLMYGGLYRLDIASYKLKPNFSCLGLNKKQSVKLTEQKKNKKKRQERLRYWNTEDLPRASSAQFAGKATDVKTLEAPDNDCFVPLESANLSEDRAEETNSTSEAADEQEDEVVCRTREFNKLLRDNPQDVHTWLAFAEFQEESVYKGNSSVGSTFTKSGNEKHRRASKVVTEKKVAVLEKALEQNAGSVELILTHLELCSEIWETEKLVERWKKVIFTHPNKTLLWKHYLLFAQSRYSAFSFAKAQSVYHKSLSTLSSIKEGTFTSHQAEGDIEKDMLELFVQMCHFLRQSGHTEKAVASFQAMVELNCCCPTTLEMSTPTSGQIAFLETFWDSGDPRFGEEGACGLQAWMESSSTCQDPAEDTIDIKSIFKLKGSDKESAAGEEEEEVALEKDRPKWEAWLQVETNRENSHTRPWQPNKSAGETEEDCEDPERLVLFDDISSGLFKLNNPRHKLTLVLHFLECLGVPAPCSDIQNYFSVCTDHKDQLLDANVPLYSQCLGLQKSSKWMAQTDGSYTWPSPQLIHIIRNVFVQSLPMFGGEAKSLLMVIWLCFEFNLCQQQKTPKEKKQKYKDVRKLSRALLKQPSNRNDLMLWQTFAEMEWASGNRVEARRIFDATLMMGSELFSEDKGRREALLPTFRSYAELEMGITSQMDDERSDDCSMRTLHILTSYAEETSFEPLSALSEVSPIRVLRARKIFQQEVADISTAVDSGLVRESGVILPSGSFIVHLTSCHALFEYLTTGIDGAVAIYDKALLRLKESSSVDHELVCTSYVRLLNFHIKRHILPLKQIRRAMMYALEQFPDNPEFLNFYIQLEIKSNISGQARRFFDKATQKGSSPVPWIFALHYEHLRSEAVLSIHECTTFTQTPSEHIESSMMTSLPPTGITHRQRSLFDRALVSPTAKHCVALWRMYMQFEMQNGDRDKAKSVFYQALQHCPWAKVIYVDAVKHFPHDLEDIMDLMTEKGLRVRTPLEEIEVVRGT